MAGFSLWELQSSLANQVTGQCATCLTQPVCFLLCVCLLQETGTWQRQDPAQGLLQPDHCNGPGSAGGSCRLLVLVLSWQTACMDALPDYKLDNTVLVWSQLACLPPAQCMC